MSDEQVQVSAARLAAAPLAALLTLGDEARLMAPSPPQVSN